MNSVYNRHRELCLTFQLVVNSIVYADVADLTFTLLNQLYIIHQYILYTILYGDMVAIAILPST